MRISCQAELDIWEEALRLAQRHTQNQGQAHAQTHSQGQTNTQTHTHTHIQGQTQGQSQNAGLSAGGVPGGLEAGVEAGAAPCATPHTAAAAVLPTPASGAPQGAANLIAQPPLPLPLLGQHTAAAPGEARAAAGAVGGASLVTVDTAGTVHTVHTVQRTHIMAPDTAPGAAHPLLAHPTPPAHSRAALQGALPPLPPLPPVPPRPTLAQQQQATVGDFFHLVFKIGQGAGGVGGVAHSHQFGLGALSGGVHGEGVETNSRKSSS